ncbi:MAG: DUF1036 domain-containing protein [Alphaproteobacteria bacterium]|nr:DUF1036 domain-containing protein [Alphaproteobacteria bacterium]
MNVFPRALPLSVPVILLSLLGTAASPREAQAAMSFCNRTQTTLEAALGYRDEGDSTAEDWVSEGWWRMEPGQCARVYAQPLTQRFYFYYAHTLAPAADQSSPTLWGGKYVFCTDDKAFRITGDGDCPSRNFSSTGFQELDLGPNTRDYTLDFKDASSK